MMSTKERPILFSAPMVRALLADTKRQTRRAVKPQPIGGDTIVQFGEGFSVGRLRDSENAWRPTRCPYGVPGDRLWVRETWRVCGGREYEHQQDRSQAMYRATHQEDGFPLTWESYDWRPSIFMPRWASRLTLEITEVRVERLRSISVADAVAEGVFQMVERTRYGDAVRTATGGSLIFADPEQAREEYRRLWESINGVGSWAMNPWVWVVAFRRVPEAAA